LTEDGKDWVGHLSFYPDDPGSKKTLVLSCPSRAEREFERVSARLNPNI
jgi:hypothetical protein